MKTIALTKYIFTIVGILLLSVAFIFYFKINSFLSEAIEANGTVVDYVKSRSSDSTTYKPVVQFNTQDGEKIEFTSSSGSSSKKYRTGANVEVLYLPLKPEKAKINSFFSLWGFHMIFGLLGAVFFGVGAGMFSLPILKKRKLQYLSVYGTLIEATYEGVERNTSYKVSGRSPYRITAQWQNPRTSEIHVLYSDNLWFDPSDHIDREKISVLIDLDNPKKYQLDTSFLPKIAK